MTPVTITFFVDEQGTPAPSPEFKGFVMQHMTLDEAKDRVKSLRQDFNGNGYSTWGTERKRLAERAHKKGYTIKTKVAVFD